MTTTTKPALRCSAWARSAALSPAGTAGSYRGFLLIEVPLPWPRDVGQVPEVAGLADLLSGRGLRVQAVVPGQSPARVILHHNPDPEAFDGFQRTEVPVGGDLRTAVAALLDGSQSSSADNRRDLLICTHGRRDVCCGSLGTELFSTVDDGPDLPANTQAWRTSHTGGHRFAPTFFVLPEGTGWAFAEAELIGQVLERRGDPSAAADHYRGCAGLGPAPVQALEREVLRRVGWELLSRRRHGAVVGDDGRTQLVVDGADSSTPQTWEAVVGPGRTLPVPDCGRPLAEATKSETEWLVAGLRQV